MALEADSGRMPLQRGVPALLQAVGQLLIAMAGADFPEYEAPPPPPRWTPTARRRRAPPEPPPREPPADDVELILADARARAHKLIEDSVIRAQELLQGQRSGDWQLLEQVRGTVTELTSEVRSLHERLDGRARGHRPRGEASETQQPVVHDDRPGDADIDAELGRDLHHMIAAFDERRRKPATLGPENVGRAGGMAEGR